MRTLILLFATLLTLQSATAQQYQPFPTNKAQWRVRENGSYKYTDILYYVNGSDTTIKGLQYTKVFARVAVTNILASNPNPPAITNMTATQADMYAGAINEQNKRVYFIRKQDSLPQLYFDFNLSVGDTVRSYDIINNMVIAATDSIKIGNIYHKRYRCTSSFSGTTHNTFITEGVGSHRSTAFDYHNGQNYIAMHCFTNNNATYTIDSFKCSYIFPFGTPTSIENNIVSAEAYIYPNPFSDFIAIEANAASIKLLDMAGRTVIQQRIHNKRVNTQNIPQGIYQLVLYDANGTVLERKKVVKE